MKEELKLIDIGNGKYILCLNDRAPCEVSKFIEQRLAECQINNICFLPVTIKEVFYDNDK